MSEFKGTKVEWEAVQIENERGSYWKVFGGETSICNIITRNMQHAEANAKLISCAPKMLEMLERVLKENHCTPDLDKEIEQLIKKATEL